MDEVTNPTGTAPDIEAMAREAALSELNVVSDWIPGHERPRPCGYYVQRVISRLREADRKEIERLKTELDNRERESRNPVFLAHRLWVHAETNGWREWEFNAVADRKLVTKLQSQIERLKRELAANKEWYHGARARVAELESENTRLRDYDASVEDWMARCQRVERERDDVKRQGVQWESSALEAQQERDALRARVAELEKELKESREISAKYEDRYFSANSERDSLTALVKAKDEALEILREQNHTLQFDDGDVHQSDFCQKALAITPDTVSRQFVRREVLERLVSACEEYIAERLMEADLITATKAARAELGEPDK